MEMEPNLKVMLPNLRDDACSREKNSPPLEGWQSAEGVIDGVVGKAVVENIFQ
jgi:hypothetical protein